MRVGLFGGSFDPVHFGHLLLAECCREQCDLDWVWFLPAAVPPHKVDRDLSSAEARIEMLELALAGHEAFAVDRYEVERGGVSFTVDTLRHFRSRWPENELFLLLGADMFNDLPNWREADEVCRLAMPVVVRRAGFSEPEFDRLTGIAPPEQLEAIRRHVVEMPQIDLRSSEIRRRVAAGESIRYQVPRSVEKYVETRGLYR
ncbi:MAG: nicotinate-nucleotide adenylyltransferase [Planctomycetota bacterium]|jgi:nicotinate-nucleotide adenylyltransferase